MRESAKQTQREVAAAMDWSSSKLIRIENGEVSITPSDLRSLLHHFGVTDGRQVDELLEMARSARLPAWDLPKGTFEPTDLSYFSFEGSASTIRVFDPVLVPALLQSEVYARAVLAEFYRLSDHQMGAGWRVWLQRQQVHSRQEPPEVVVILDESVVRRQIGGASGLRSQLEAMNRWGAMSHVALHVIPFDAAACRGAKTSFAVLDFAHENDDSLVHYEDSTGASKLTDKPTVVTEHLDRFAKLESVALSTEETRRLIDAAIEEMDEVT